LAHPDVCAAVVAAVGEPRGDKRLVAYIVPRDGATAPARTTVIVNGRGAHGVPPEGGGTLILDPAERVAFRREGRARLVGVDEASAVVLPRRALGVPAVAEQRRSARRFGSHPVTLEQLGTFLACLVQCAPDGSPSPKYSYPSAGGLYPMQTYVYSKPNGIFGLMGGGYYHDPIAHRLAPVSRNRALDHMIHAPANRELFDQSAFAVFLVAEMAAIEPMYGTLARDLCLLEAGYMGQVLVTSAHPSGIGLCPIGAFYDEPVREMLALGASQVILHSFVGGAMSAEQSSTCADDAGAIAAVASRTLERPAARNASMRQPLVEEVRSFLRAKLPPYMVPTSLVVLDALPLTQNGKIDRHALPRPQDETPSIAAGSVRSATEVEEVLTGIVRDMTGRRDTRADDNFFDLGIDSLGIIRIHHKVRELLGADVPIALLFKYPSVKLLAHEVKVRVERGGESSPPVPTGQRVQVDRATPTRFPLTIGQEAMWFFHKLAPESPAFNTALAFRFPGAPDLAAIATATMELCARHAMLRTHFEENESAVTQVVRDRVSGWLRHVVLSESGDQVLGDLLANDLGEPFNLETGPSFRLHVYSIGCDATCVMLVQHHIANDLYSIDLLSREWQSLYRAAVRSETAMLPSPGAAYSDFVAWQKAWLESSEALEDRAYWRARLGGALPPLRLPTDHPRPARQRFQGGAVGPAPLPLSVADGLRRLARGSGATLTQLMLAAYAALLHRTSQQETIVIGVPGLGRPSEQFTDTVGYFINALAIRTDWKPGAPFVDWLAEVGRSLQEAMVHGQYPFQAIVRDLQLRPDAQRPPLFQTMFTLMNRALAPGMIDDGKDFSHVPVPQLEGQFDLTLAVIDVRGEMMVEWRYDADLFERATIERLARRFESLLEGVVASSHAAVDQLPLVSHVEHHGLGRAAERPERVERNGSHVSDRGLALDLSVDAHVTNGPRSDVESSTLAKICSEMLGAPHVGPDDNFFDLGGHSLILSKLAARVRATFNVSLALHEVFEQPTVGALAALIKSRSRGDAVGGLTESTRDVPDEDFKRALLAVEAMDEDQVERALENLDGMDT
jgi:SagB-type dehydrogenase family enzyme